MDQIGDLVNRLLRGSDLILANPKALDRLKQESNDLQRIDPLPLDEALVKLFEIRRSHAEKIAAHIPGCPSWEIPIQALYDEIRQCALFGLNGAAIALCGTLVEFVMKYATYCRKEGSKISFDSKVWEKYENCNFASAIEQALKVKLIDNHQSRVLREYKDNIRNPYAHYNILKLTKHAVWKKVRVKNIETGEIHEKDFSVSDDPTMQALAKQKIDSDSVINVLNHTTDIVSHFVSEMNADLAKRHKST